jgi:hypothetical protein
VVDDRSAEEVIYAGERWSTDRPIDVVLDSDDQLGAQQSVQGRSQAKDRKMRE